MTQWPDAEDPVDYQGMLETIAEQARAEFGKGQVADYIPGLARVPAERFAMAVRLVDGREFAVGAAEEAFSIQSISKVFALTLALRTVDTQLWRRVGREPSGTAFNSLVQLEYEHGIPRNPFINAGAIVVVDALQDAGVTGDAGVIDFIRTLAGNPAAAVDEAVYRSECDYGDLNRAVAYFLKAHGNLRQPVEQVTRAYFRQCALAMDCRDLARAIAFLANGGVAPDGNRVVDARRVKRINAVMLTCGVYDGAGEFAFRVGMPAKSGVGGGIVAVIPGLLSVAVWSPALDRQGNSVAGVAALDAFTTALGRSVF